ncbi:MAG: hypothetical protein JEZ00_03400 [Anaerolineaceae bacterium]|nr:hypothetical protein [Anaerolineaceae bacterium]
MGDLFQQVNDSQDFVKKILSKVPGFQGYIERENRRASDKVLRELVAQRYQEEWKRVSSIQSDLVNEGELKYVGDLETAALKLSQFSDRIKTAAYGHSSFFEAVKINETELQSIYEYDLKLFDSADEIARAVDNVAASIGTDGMPAAIRNLVSLSQEAVDLFNHRAEVFLSFGEQQ